MGGKEGTQLCSWLPAFCRPTLHCQKARCNPLAVPPLFRIWRWLWIRCRLSVCGGRGACFEVLSKLSLPWGYLRCWFLLYILQTLPMQLKNPPSLSQKLHVHKKKSKWNLYPSFFFFFLFLFSCITLVSEKVFGSSVPFQLTGKCQLYLFSPVSVLHWLSSWPFPS